MDLTFKQYFPITVMIAIIAFFLMLLDLLFAKVIFAGEGATNYFVVWVAFQAWAMYFLGGCTYEGGVKVVLGYLGGVLASIAILELSGVLSFLSVMAVPVAVLIVVVPVICADRVPWFNFVPAWFVGAGAFFGLKVHVGVPSYMDAAIMTLLSCIVGCLFGVVTILGRTKYEASLAAKLAAEGAGAPAEPAESESAESESAE